MKLFFLKAPKPFRCSARSQAGLRLCIKLLQPRRAPLKDAHFTHCFSFLLMEIKIFPRIKSSEEELSVILWESLNSVLRDKIKGLFERHSAGQRKILVIL